MEEASKTSHSRRSKKINPSARHYTSPPPPTYPSVVCSLTFRSASCAAASFCLVAPSDNHPSMSATAFSLSPSSLAVSYNLPDSFCVDSRDNRASATAPSRAASNPTRSRLHCSLAPANRCAASFSSCRSSATYLVCAIYAACILPSWARQGG